MYDEEGHVMVRNKLQAGDGVLLNTGDWIKVDPDEPLAARKPDHSALAQINRTYVPRDRRRDPDVQPYRWGPTQRDCRHRPAADKNGNAGKNAARRSTSSAIRPNSTTTPARRLMAYLVEIFVWRKPFGLHRNVIRLKKERRTG